MTDKKYWLFAMEVKPLESAVFLLGNSVPKFNEALLVWGPAEKFHQVDEVLKSNW